MRVRLCYVFFFKEKTAYEMRISDWSSDVCSSDLLLVLHPMRSRAFLAEAALLVGLVLVVVAGEELDVRVAFERDDVGGDAVEEPARSEERRVGKEGVRTCRFRRLPYHYTKQHRSEVQDKYNNRQSLI